jgi:hypothetical protein
VSCLFVYMYLYLDASIKDRYPTGHHGRVSLSGIIQEGDEKTFFLIGVGAEPKYG